MFFSFDGIDGTGKTTQIKLFCDWLGERGHDVVACRDPGTTQLGEALRDLVLTRGTVNIDRCSEMLIYMAARAQLVREVIQPALAAGKVVVSDRYLLANIVYQGYAGGLDVETLRQVGQIATAGVEPELIFVLDMDVQQAARRLERTLDRMESRGEQYLRQVREGFLREAEHQRKGILVIDADRDIESIQADIRRAAEKVLAKSA